MTTANLMMLPETRISEFVADMAWQYCMAHTRTYADAWCETVTRLAKSVTAWVKSARSCTVWMPPSRNCWTSIASLVD